MLTAEELAELRRIHVVAGRRVDSLFGGDWRSAVRGQGMEFEEVRAYVPGDDVRHIDWNVTARSGEPFVKVFREERQATVLLVVDVSGSTRTGSGGRDGRTDRRLQMARIAGALALAALRNRDRVGLLTFSNRVERWMAPRQGPGHGWGVVQHVYADHAVGRGTDIAAALGTVDRLQRRRAVVVLVSDFFDGADWARPLAALARRHRVHGVLVHDPLDDAPDLGLFEAFDAETGERRLVDGAAWKARMSIESRVAAVRRTGAHALAIGTGDDALMKLHDHFRREARR
jgi:uncharacterized protein (DUF58 family)